ncbi:hypothetical protein Z947_2021 [Sulfitobacter geojensis]|nr:hypothetical protein Z947_2021 [Sulfitobacter geojensis]NYI29146.1 hypothetical protein [Sulfitobacter geojensis]
MSPPACKGRAVYQTSVENDLPRSFAAAGFFFGTTAPCLGFLSDDANDRTVKVTTAAYSKTVSQAEGVSEWGGDYIPQRLDGTDKIRTSRRSGRW